MKLRSALVLPFAALVLAGCASNSGPVPAPASLGPLGQAFASSASANDVPRDLLIAIAVVEEGLTLPATRDVDPENEVPAAGPLMLRHGRFDSLARGATLMTTTELDLRRNAELGLEAGARVVAELGKKLGANADLATWESALEELGGFADDAHRVDYAHQVFAVLARGGTFEGRDGEKLTLAAHDVPPSLVFTIDTGIHTLANPDYAGAEWFPTSCANKCDTDRGGQKVQYFFIHDTECGWAGSVATLQNDPGKSVHYIVGTYGRVGQFVPETYTAWHAGNYFYNQRSVGIEHVGYSTKPDTEAEYAASAKLVAYLTKKFNVPKDRAHIIGHEQVPNGDLISSSSAPCATSPKECEGNTSYGGSNHHTDPGVWEWATYMPRFGGSAKCNDVWALWNCSNDKNQAFRCQNDKVEVEVCDAPEKCEVQALGTADVCHKLPIPPKDGGTVPPSTDGGTTPTSDSGATPPPPSADDQGCNASGSNARANGLYLALALSALVASRRKKR
ncbi:hypothetical protein BH09MYX1_BH09MYX1_49660 [soil metagenome]